MALRLASAKVLRGKSGEHQTVQVVQAAMRGTGPMGPSTLGASVVCVVLVLVFVATKGSYHLVLALLSSAGSTIMLLASLLPGCSIPLSSLLYMDVPLKPIVMGTIINVPWKMCVLAFS